VSTFVRACRAALIGALLTVGCPTARADAVDVANAVRARGCERNPGARSALRQDAALDTVARELAHGRNLDQALAQAAYRPKVVATLRFEGAYSEGALAAALSAKLCDPLTDPAIRDIGNFGGPAGVWIVVARRAEAATLPPSAGVPRGRADLRPTPPRAVRPAPLDVAALERELVERVNSARAQARRCGHEEFGPAAPLRFIPALERVAAAHSEDMAAHHEFDHAGHDGATPAQRVRRAGYPARLIGENIAFGSMSAAEAVSGWLASPGHCENIMDPRFRETGIAVARGRGQAGTYFTEVFVQPAATRADGEQ
jgi:uncharacterized protein YkwD